KSDDLRNRSVLRRLLESGDLRPESIPEPAAPESLLILQAELKALSLDVKLAQAEEGVAYSIRAASPDDILKWSSGPVHSDEKIDYRTMDEIEGGIFCPKVFGSPDHPRRRRFGHIELKAPVISLLWRLGKPSPLERLLGIPGAIAEEIIYHKLGVRRDGDQWEIVRVSAKQHPEPELLTRAAAIEAMLKATPASRLPRALNDPGILVQRAIPIVPPEFRPFVLMDSGNFASSDLNDLYERLIKRNIRLRKLKPLGAPAPTIINETNQ